MVNRDARRTTARLIQAFADGEITRDTFLASFPADNSDPVLAGVLEQLWFFWDDFADHRLTGDRSPTPEVRSLVERCVLFLRSELEYEWPAGFMKAPFSLIALRLLRLGSLAERRERLEENRIRSLGDIDCWPFIRAGDLQSQKTGQSP
jgi:hypothetical protein